MLPHKDSSGAYYFSVSDLPYIVDSNSWNLDFVADPSESQLNFVVYVPETSFSPLHIKSPEGGYSETNAFLIPQWGGIVILNPDYSSVEKNSGVLEHVPSFLSSYTL